MRITPADLGLTQQDVNSACEWWSALSINQMKAIEAKHNQKCYGWSQTHYLWTLEGKPAPQELIPVVMTLVTA